MRWKAQAACLALMLSAIDGANAGGESPSRAALCAEREVLLQTLVEAHGETPSAASMIINARAACHEGRIDDAVALYDRVIGDLGSAVKLGKK